MTVVVREATLMDAVQVAQGKLAAHYTSLVGYMTMSDKVYVGVVDGDIVCIWGILRQSLLSTRGYLWLLTTPEAEEHKFIIIRWSQRIIEELLKRYTVLTGECAINNPQARKWMKFLGATFDLPIGSTIPFQIVGKNG